MLYANVDLQKIRATKGAIGVCPGCGQPVRAYCGQHLIHHWKHKAQEECDPWSEPEGPWHREWKSLVQSQNVEVTMREERDGVLYHHRADVVGEGGVVVELQHSPISSEHIEARESFYGNMIWVFDATRFVERLDGGPTDCLSIWRRRCHADDWRDHADGNDKLHANVLIERNAPVNFITDDRVIPWVPKWHLRWSHPHKTILSVKRPLFFDFGPTVATARAFPGTILKVTEIERDGGDVYVVGRWMTRAWFARKYLGTVCSDTALLEEAELERQVRYDRISAFRSLRLDIRKRSACEAEVAAARRRAQEERSAKLVGIRNELLEIPWDKLWVESRKLTRLLLDEYRLGPEAIEFAASYHPSVFTDADIVLLKDLKILVVDRRRQYEARLVDKMGTPSQTSDATWDTLRDAVLTKRAGNQRLTPKEFSLWRMLGSIEDRRRSEYEAEEIGRALEAEAELQVQEFNRAKLMREEEIHRQQERRQRILAIAAPWASKTFQEIEQKFNSSVPSGELREALGGLLDALRRCYRDLTVNYQRARFQAQQTRELLETYTRYNSPTDDLKIRLRHEEGLERTARLDLEALTAKHGHPTPQAESEVAT